MFQCYICSYKAVNVSCLIRHLRKSHALYEGAELRLKCPNEKCNKVYETFSGYRKHVHNCLLHFSHKHLERHQSSATDHNEKSVVELFDFNHHLVSDNRELSANDYCTNYISKLYSLGIPDSTVQTIIESTEDFLKCFLNPNIKYEQIKNAFSDVNTKFKRESYFNNHIVKPIEISIGVRYDQVFNKKKKIYEQTHKEMYFFK